MDEVTASIGKEVDLKDAMQSVFDFAILKAESRSGLKGNTETPWKDFPIDHLRKRMYVELVEYEEHHNSQELIDVINIACFLRLAHLKHLAENLPEGFGDDPLAR